MHTNIRLKQIQLLGSTFVSGYFAFAEIVNYKQFNQRKIIKDYEYGGLVCYSTERDFLLNVTKKDDTLSDIGIYQGGALTDIKSTFYTAPEDVIISVPYDYPGSLVPVSSNTRVYASSNKSIRHYLFVPKGETIFNKDALSYSVFMAYGLDNLTAYNVCFIDLCINTTEPITLNYVGEAEFIQNSNIDNNFTPLFKINRYDYNCY